MSNKKHKFRNGNNQIAKYTDRITTAEKQLSHKRLKARALCTHTKEPMMPNLAYREENGKLTWVCKTCGEKIDLTRISDADLQKAINTISQACNMIKMMSGDTDKDRRVVEEIIAEIQLKLNAYMMPAYKAALNNSNKQGRNKQNRRTQSVTWGSSRDD